MSVRAATVADARAITDVRIASWRAAYGAHLPEHVWDEVDPDADAERLAARLTEGARRALVAEVDGVIRAFCTYGPARDADAPAGAGEIYGLYADPQHWSTGLGRALMAATTDALAARPILLWVLENNARARRFYERAGFAPDGASKTAELLGGVRLPEMRYRRG